MKNFVFYGSLTLFSLMAGSAVPSVCSLIMQRPAPAEIWLPASLLLGVAIGTAFVMLPRWFSRRT